MKSVILIAFARIHIALQMVFSIYLLLRGHNLPGGGFIGGLLATGALALYLIAYGQPWKPRWLPGGFNPMTVAALGLMLAIASGIPALLDGTPYMTPLWGGEIFIPVVGMTKIGSPLFFDIGVYLVVLGVCTALVYSLHPQAGESGPDMAAREVRR